MPRPPAPVAIGDLCDRLIDSLTARVAAGSLTVRRLAKEVGVSQPHMQNIINRKRPLTMNMADRLLRYQHRSVLELASSSELGEALRLTGASPDAMQYVPVLPGRLGPAHPFPETTDTAAWRHLPASAIAHVAHPAFTELGSDEELSREFPGVTFALLDLASQSTAKISPRLWYAIRWSGGGWIRRLRLDSGTLHILGQESLHPALEPARIELGTSTVDKYVRALVVWLGNDPGQVNPLRGSGYRLAPPAADS